MKTLQIHKNLINTPPWLLTRDQELTLWFNSQLAQAYLVGWGLL